MKGASSLPPDRVTVRASEHSAPSPAGTDAQCSSPRSSPTSQAFSNTYLFYGTYRAEPEGSSAYSIRLAYLLSPLACLLLCFCGTLRR